MKEKSKETVTIDSSLQELLENAEVFVPRETSFVFDKPIDEDSLAELVEFYNSLPPDVVSTTVYLNTPGGYMSYMYLFKDLLERNGSRLVANGHVFSAGLILMLIADVEKEVLDFTIGMHHRMSYSGQILSDDFKPIMDKFYKKAVSEKDEYLENSIFEFLEFTDKEKKHYKKNKDIFISTSRLKKAVEFSKKLKKDSE